MFFFAVILFLLLVLATLMTLRALPHVFFGRRLFFARSFVVLFNAAAAFFFVANGDRVRDLPFAAPVIVVVSVVFMAELILSVLVFFALAVRALLRRAEKAPHDAERRRLLACSVFYPAAASSLALYGGACERKSLVEREYEIPVGGDFAPYRIAQLSDVHLGLFFSVADFEELLSRVANGKPDVLVITGDVFDDAQKNEAAAELLGRFVDKFPDGIYFCYGNHEYYRGIKKTREYLARTRIGVLLNDAVPVRGGTRPLWFAGVDYPLDRARFDELRDSYAERALQKIPPDAVTVLLAHHPEFIDNAAAKNVKLTLTGHTHGCQLGILGMPLFPVFKYTRGMVRHGESFGYVHCGNGSWFPFRLGCPPEIAYFNLK